MSPDAPTPESSSREDELVQLLLTGVETAKAARAHSTITLEVQVADGEVRGARITHTKHWQPAALNRRRARGAVDRPPEGA